MDENILKKGDVREFTFQNGKKAVGIVSESEPDGRIALFIPSFVEADARQFYKSGLLRKRTDPFPGEGIVDPKDILDAKIKRGLPKEYRECLTAGMEKMNQFRKGRQILEKVREQQLSLTKECNEIIKKTRDISGVLTRKEFEKELLKQLPEEAKKSLSAYSFTNPCEVLLSAEEQIYLTKSTDTWITARDMPFCYIEYDGNVFMKDNPGRYQKYNEIIRKYHKERPGIGIKQSESLYIAGGYNGRIIYQSFYCIPKPKEYTKETAKEAARFIAGNRKERQKNR